MAWVQIKKAARLYTSCIFMVLFVTLTLSIFPSYSESTNITFTKIKELSNFPILIPISEGNTNGDSTYEGADYFADLDIQGNDDYLSLGTFKNNSVRILKLNKDDGSLILSESQAFTDPITGGSQAATRGPNTITPDGKVLFFPGNGPNESGFDRIYSYSISSGGHYFFLPSDLPTTLRVTPNSKYLVYLQANTTNNNLASIQSVEIKENASLNEAFIGQFISEEIQAGTTLEFANGPGAKDRANVIGIFSNLQHGKNGSGDGFAIFKTNQNSGTNTILKEFKKSSRNNPLPVVFNNSSFVGFSGFELVEKDSGTYLFVSYVENSSVNFPGYDYITRVIIFKVVTTSTSVELIQAGSPFETTFQLSPCNEKKFQGISGQLKIVDNNLYIADNNPTQDKNYFAVFNINWGSILTGTNSSDTLTLASVPKKINETKGERATDLIITKDNKLAYLTTIQPKGATSTKIKGYSLEYINIPRSQLLSELNKEGICTAEITKPSKQFEEPEILKDITKPPSQNFSTPLAGISLSQGTTTGRPPLFGSTTGSTSPSTFSPPSASISTRPNLPQEFPKTFPGFQETINEFLTETTANIGRPTRQPTAPAQPEYKTEDKATQKGIPIQEPIRQESRIPSEEDLLDLLLVEAEEEEELKGDIEIEGLDLVLLSSESSKLEATPLKTSSINSLDLSGKDQIIIPPKVPWISFSEEGIQEAKIETIENNSTKKANKQEDTKKAITKSEAEKPKLIQVSELSGAINKGDGGYLINLKNNIKLKKKDLDNISYVIINKKDEVLEIDGETLNSLSGKILAKLSFENIKESGTYKLVVLLDKGKDKKEVISKGKIDIFNSYEFENVGKKTTKINEKPTISTIDGRIVGDSYKGGKIVRLVLHGKNFASRLIMIKNKLYISQPLKTNTSISFVGSENTEIIRTRILHKGCKMLVVIRLADPNISSVPLTISTPFGQFLKEKIGIKLLNGSTQRSTKLELD